MYKTNENNKKRLKKCVLKTPYFLFLNNRKQKTVFNYQICFLYFFYFEENKNYFKNNLKQYNNKKYTYKKLIFKKLNS